MFLWIFVFTRHYPLSNSTSWPRLPTPLSSPAYPLLPSPPIYWPHVFPDACWKKLPTKIYMLERVSHFELHFTPSYPSLSLLPLPLPPTSRLLSSHPSFLLCLPHLLASLSQNWFFFSGLFLTTYLSILLSACNYMYLFIYIYICKFYISHGYYVLDQYVHNAYMNMYVYVYCINICKFL